MSRATKIDYKHNFNCFFFTFWNVNAQGYKNLNVKIFAILMSRATKIDYKNKEKDKELVIFFYINGDGIHLNQKI